MSTTARLAGFAAVLVVVFLLGWRLGFVHGHDPRTETPATHDTPGGHGERP